MLAVEVSRLEIVGFNVKVEVGPARQDFTVSSPEEIVEIARRESFGGLHLDFFEGRGALKCWILSKRYQPIGGGHKCVAAIELLGDEGGKDHHRDPGRYSRMMADVECLAPDVVAENWKGSGLQSLRSAVEKIEGKKGGIGSAIWYCRRQQFFSFLTHPFSGKGRREYLGSLIAGHEATREVMETMQSAAELERRYNAA